MCTFFQNTKQKKGVSTTKVLAAWTALSAIGIGVSHAVHEKYAEDPGVLGIVYELNGLSFGIACVCSAVYAVKKLYDLTGYDPRADCSLVND